MTLSYVTSAPASLAPHHGPSPLIPSYFIPSFFFSVFFFHFALLAYRRLSFVTANEKALEHTIAKTCPFEASPAIRATSRVNNDDDDDDDDDDDGGGGGVGVGGGDDGRGGGGCDHGDGAFYWLMPLLTSCTINNLYARVSFLFFISFYYSLNWHGPFI
jgi:hypothetical protein